MRQENLTILQREIDRLQREIDRTPYGTINFGVVLHDGLIQRIIRSVETTEHAAPVRRFGAGGGS